MEGDDTPRPLVQTDYEEAVARFSPDGRYLAYHSNEPGQYEVYVQPYPGVEGRRQVSSGGGIDPIWSPGGDELFYHNGPQVRAARIETEPVLTVGTRRVVFEGSFLNFPGPIYDLAPDGRFLLLESVEEASTSRHLNVVVNWFEELKRLVPVDR